MRIRRYLAILLPVLVVAYAAILRFDAVTSSYGPVTSPAWLHALQTHSTGPLRFLRPKNVHWDPVPNYPHADGPRTHYISDPYTYLEFARAMRSFSGAHYREPVFPYVTKQFLRLLNDQDVAVSFASAFFSVLVVVATYLLGTFAFSRWVGLLAAMAMAIELDVITWGIGGWRDDAFAFSVVLSAYAMLRYARLPSNGHAVLLGICAGFACLVRITSVSFLLPGFAYLLVTGSRPWKDRIRSLGIVVLALTVIAGPYVVNCWRVFGDPLYAIDYHTSNYLKAEGQVTDVRPSALSYVQSKLTSRPMQTLDTAVLGVTTYPFLNKWQGFDQWVPGLGQALLWAALAGLLLYFGSAAGRLLLVILLCSLLPYATTWRLISDWRFTEHAYPFFLIAASLAIVRLITWVAGLRLKRHLTEFVPTRRAVAFWSMVLGATALGCWTVLRLFPVWTAKESLLANDQVTIMSGDRDGAFFGEGWSEPRIFGNMTARVSQGPHAVVRIPLPRAGDYDLTVRIAPFPLPPADDLTQWPTLQVALNETVLGSVQLHENPGRMGSYEIHLSRGVVRTGFNRLALTANSGVTSGGRPSGSAGIAGDRFDLWYLKIQPRISPTPARVAIEATPSRYRGYVDLAGCAAIVGWVADLGQLNAPVDVAFFAGASPLGRVTADGFRSDLVRAGIGNGQHAYTFALPAGLKDGASHSVTVEVANTTFNLVGSPVTIKCPGGR